MLKKEAEQRTSSEEILDMLNCRTPGFQEAFHWPDGQTPPAFAHVCLGDFSVSLAQQRQGDVPRSGVTGRSGDPLISSIARKRFILIGSMSGFSEGILKRSISLHER